MRRRAVWLLPVLLVLAAFLFYAATLAPGLLWGDSAKFQRMAWQGELRFDETGHPLWVALAHPLTRIPGLEPARAVNLWSALLSSLALWPAFRLMKRFGASDTAAALACLALAVSHTFWFHAVIAEVYAFNSLVTLAMLDLVTAAASEGRARGTLFWLTLGLALGLVCGNHLQVLAWLPGYAWWTMAGQRRGRISWGHAALAGFGVIVGMLPFILWRETYRQPETLSGLAQRLMTQTLLPPTPGRDALQLAAYLLYQFPLPLIPLAAVAGAAALWRRRRADLIGLAILYAASVATVFSYRVPDRFAFYLPSHIVVALMAAPGIDRLLEWAGARARAAAVAAAAVLAIAAPPFVYHAAPRLAGAGLLKSFPSPRALPGRDSVRYFLDPNKRGETGARAFCHAALEPLPPRAVVLADYTLEEPLNYTQIAEGLRPDVEVYYALPRDQLRVALDLSSRGRPVYLAAIDAPYDPASIATRFDIRPAGPIYALSPKIP